MKTSGRAFLKRSSDLIVGRCSGKTLNKTKWNYSPDHFFSLPISDIDSCNLFLTISRDIRIVLMELKNIFIMKKEELRTRYVPKKLCDLAILPKQYIFQDSVCNGLRFVDAQSFQHYLFPYITITFGYCWQQWLI